MRAILLGVLIAATLPSLSAAAHDARPLAVHLDETHPDRWMVRTWAPPGQPEPALTLEGCESADLVQRCEGDPSALVVDYGEVAPAVTTVIQVRWRSGRRATLAVPPGNGRVAIPTEPSTWETATSYLTLGWEHIFLGWDHLLFLALLVLVVRTPKRTALTVTGFTLAHGLTLALAVTGLVRPASAAVEPIIALSIVVLALEVARGRTDSWSLRHPIAIAFVFGLLHGFGFAGVLLDAGVPRPDLSTALLSFHVGVELGQLVFVAVVGVVLHALRRREITLDRWVAYGAGIAGTHWLLVRLAPLVAAL
ncbi:MAG: HupE/UreJ family protein [Deltaproteobacteria bacterium]|nr:HupE/UreJ family protein [Deltaproteobacteria bacterium]